MQHLVVVRVTYSLSPAVGQIRTMPSNGGGHTIPPVQPMKPVPIWPVTLAAPIPQI